MILNIYKIKLLSNKYIIFKTKLFDNSNTIIVCIDNNFETSFINKLLLFKNNLFKKLDIVLFVTIQNIIDKKIVDKYIYLSIYIIDANKVVLEVCFYIIKEIKSDIILKNNILELF